MAAGAAGLCSSLSIKKPSARRPGRPPAERIRKDYALIAIPQAAQSVFPNFFFVRSAMAAGVLLPYAVIGFPHPSQIIGVGFDFFTRTASTISPNALILCTHRTMSLSFQFSIYGLSKRCSIIFAFVLLRIRGFISRCLKCITGSISLRPSALTTVSFFT